MKGFIVALSIAALLGNGVVLAKGGQLRLLQRGLAAHTQESGKLTGLLGKAKQFGAGVLLTGLFICGLSACTKDEVANSLQEQQSRVASLDYGQSATLKEITTALELAEGAQIGIVKSDQQTTLTFATDDGTVYLQLQEGDVLVNNSDTPLKVTLYEEEVDEGWIAEGSWTAIIPAGVVALAGLATAGAFTIGTWIDESGNNIRETLTVGGIGLIVVTGLTIGTYHLLLLL